MKDVARKKLLREGMPFLSKKPINTSTNIPIYSKKGGLNGFKRIN